MSSPRHLRVGVIALGWMGRLHSASYLALPQKFPNLEATLELATACDPLEANREFARKGLGFHKTVSDYKEVINDPDIDIVSICTPNYLHKEIAVAAAEAGKPFWIEKPMGISAKQAGAIAKAVQDNDVITSVGFNYRHTPAVEQARQLIADGKLGRITNVRCWFIADYASSEDGPFTWRYDKERAGSGVVGDLMSHGVDLVHYVLQSPITQVNALTDTFITERPLPLKAGVGHTGWEVSDERVPVENEDYVAMMARLENGVVGTLESSRVSVGPRAEYVIEVYGTQGSLRWDFERLNELEVCLGQDNGTIHGYTRVLANTHFPFFANFQPGPGNSMGFDDMKCVEAYQFIQGILTHRQIGPSVADGWLAAEVDEATVASAQEGIWKDVAPVSGSLTFNQPTLS
ncbi:MAG: Gfo/Idh/MocA family oxidoreductase [Actinomycetaceae bacterium]|nr:Gfo/Idh/MocA family oxidoreductase [Actinomycetaceae bacterium]